MKTRPLPSRTKRTSSQSPFRRPAVAFGSPPRTRNEMKAAPLSRPTWRQTRSPSLSVGSPSRTPTTRHAPRSTTGIAPPCPRGPKGGLSRELVLPEREGGHERPEGRGRRGDERGVPALRPGGEGPALPPRRGDRGSLRRGVPHQDLRHRALPARQCRGEASLRRGPGRGPG